MTRFVNALLVFLMVLSAAAVYDMKYEAETASIAVADLEQKIANEQAELSLLKAEWSMLTQPARMTELIGRYTDILQLQPLTADQIGTLADIPEKPEPILDEGTEAGDTTASITPARPDAVEGVEPMADDDGLSAGDDSGLPQ